MSEEPPTVAVVGASRDRSKYGNKSVRAHVAQGYRVFPIHPQEAEVEGLPAYPSVRDVPVERLDRISVYVPPAVALSLLEDFAARQPGEVWLNPGSESEEVVARAEEMGLNVIQACSIVDVGRTPGEFA